jgi:uncharacterized repeat protein (TIGR03803 family)
MKRFLLAIITLAFAVTAPRAHTQTFKVLHQFDGVVGDGANSHAGLIRDNAGNLFGTTFDGGIGEGTVFKIDGTTGVETVLFTFTPSVSGGFPASPLVQDQAGNLYGIADLGPGGAGVVFKISQDGTETLLEAFQGGLGRNARVPSGGVLRDKVGNIFGTTLAGGNGTCFLGCGSVYRLDSTGALHIRHFFSGGADGSQPFGPLVRDAAGNLFGVAQQGGNLSCAEFPQVGCGTVFKIAPNGVFTVLHTFAGGADGALPQAGLLMDKSGNIFGATGAGGTTENGLVFTISADGTYKVLHQFVGSDGSVPNGRLIVDSNGNLFGTTQLGGSDALGTVFEMTAAGQVTVLHSFTGLEDGATPMGGVIRDSAGNLFGTASKNFLIQPVQGGCVFEITP